MADSTRERKENGPSNTDKDSTAAAVGLHGETDVQANLNNVTEPPRSTLDTQGIVTTDSSSAPAIKNDQQEVGLTYDGDGNNNDQPDEHELAPDGDNAEHDSTLHEKEVEYLKAKVRKHTVEKVADMCTFGLYGTAVGVHDVAKALHDDELKQQHLADQMKETSVVKDASGPASQKENKVLVDWKHKGYVVANAWTDGALDIAEELYEEKKKGWKEHHPDHSETRRLEGSNKKLEQPEEEEPTDAPCGFLPGCC